MGAIIGALVGFCIVAEGSKRKLLVGALALLMMTDFFLASMGRDYVNLSPDRWNEFAVRGYENLQDHDYQRAVEHLEKAVKLNRQDPDTWNLLGFAYQELGKLEEATDAVAHAYNLRPSSNEYRQILARCKGLLGYRSHVDGNQAKAVSLYEEALALDNDNVTTWYNLALAHYQLGNIVSAKKAADHATSLDPTNSEYQSFKEFLEKTFN
jgi:tetratricopeptide (TPR) repeat protein